MKRTVLLAALLIAASACAAPAPSNNSTTSNQSTANTSPAPASSPAASLVTEADALAGVKGSVNGKPLPPDFAERDSTAWMNRGGKWLVDYHQETMIKEPPPMPTPGGSPPPKVVASPAASPAAATATDMEKQVWDALKRGDYAAFAAFL